MRIRALIIRIWRQFLRDRRTLALMMAAPLLILWMVALIFNGSTYQPKLGAVGLPRSFATRLVDQNAVIQDYATQGAAVSALKSRKIDAVLQLDGRVPHLLLEGSNPAKSTAVIVLLQKAIQPPDAKRLAPVVHYLYGSAGMSSFDNFGPVLIGVFAFFFVFIIAGIAFLKERTSGTLERLMATPLRRWEIVVGYIAGFGLFTTIQACIIAWFSVDVLGMMMKGEFLYLLLVTLLLSLTALTLGTFLSAFANTEFQMMQFVPIIILPQVFFSGLFSTSTMAPWLRGVSRIMPLYYGADALRNVMIRGQGFPGIYPDLLILLGLSVCFMAANVIALRKYRKI